MPRIKRLWLPALIVLLALAARFVPAPRTIDDAFITYRYARNLLAGDGFVFNPGERVQGTTTPLYTLLMAALAMPWAPENAPFPWLALAVNAAADAATCLLLLQLGRRCAAPRAGLAAALCWAIAPYSVTFAIGGLETSLYVLLLTALVWFFVRRRFTPAALCAALSILTRPDAVLLVAPLILHRLWIAVQSASPKPVTAGSTPVMAKAQPGEPSRHVPRALRGLKTIPWSELAAFLAPTLTWAAFATLYFGTPLPHSVAAKLAVYRLAASDAFIRLVQHFATPFMQQNYLGPLAGIALGLLLFPFLYIVGARHALRAEKLLLAFVLYPWLYLVVFSLPNPLIFRWYLTPPLPAYFLFILAGAEAMLEAIRRSPTKAPPAGQPSSSFIFHPSSILSALLVILLPVASLLTGWRPTPDHGPTTPAPEMAFIKLELLYAQAAAQIAPSINSSTLLAAGDVGVLGYSTPARILDTVGLNSPVSLNFYPLDPSAYVINYAIPASLILDQQPDWVVILEAYARNTLLQDERFLHQYRLYAVLPTDIYGSQGLLIFCK